MRRKRDDCRSPRSVFLASVALGIGYAVEAIAATNLDEMGLEELLRVDVVSASRFTQSAEQAPSSVTVISEGELRQHGYRTVAEALVTVPGVYASYDRGNTYLGVRGFNRPGDYGTRILLLTDGLRRNSPLYDQALFGNEAPVELDWVKRIEFVPGPASAVYGSNALFGTANAVMLDGGDVNGSRVTLEAGSFGKKYLDIIAGRRLPDDREWFIGFADEQSDGDDLYFPEFDNGTTDGHARGLDGEKYRKLYAKYRWGQWHLTGNFSTREKDVPTAWYETTFGQSGTTMRDDNYLVELRYEGEPVSNWQRQFRLFAGRYEFEGRYRYRPSTPDARDEAIANWFGSEIQFAYTGLDHHRFSFGLAGQWNTRLEQRYFDISPHTDYLTTNNPSRVISVSVQDQWQFAENWLLNAALRADKHSDYAVATSPRLALVWQPTTRLSLKAIVGQSYRVPNVYERYYDDGGISQKGNPDLKPETIRTTELAADYLSGTKGRFGISIYRNSIRDLIDIGTDASGTSQYRNLDEAKAHGIEISGENTWDNDVSLRGSVGWQHSEQADGTTLVDSPRWTGKLVLGLPFMHGWRAAGELIGISARRGDNGQVPGYGIVNLALTSPTYPGYGQLRLSIDNLTDRHYADPANVNLFQRAIVQDGRQIRLLWTLSF